MAQAAGPDLGLVAKIECYPSVPCFTGGDGQEVVVQPSEGMAIKQSRGKLRAMAAYKHDPPCRVAQQRPDPGPVHHQIDRVEAAQRIGRKLTGMALILDADITAQAKSDSQLPDQQNSENRSAKLRQLDQTTAVHLARTASMSIICRTGPRS